MTNRSIDEDPEMTAHEEEARALMAGRLGRTAARWSVVVAPEPATWYDFADPETGQVGQCILGRDGTWRQAPRGNRPVVFAYWSGTLVGRTPRHRAPGPS